MGYLALAILIGVIIWTLWRLFTHKRLPLTYYSTLNDEEKSESETKKNDEDTNGK